MNVRNGTLLVMLALASFAMATSAYAHEADSAASGRQVIDLWSGTPPTGNGHAPRGPERIRMTGRFKGAVSNIRNPRMVVLQPARPNGAAVLIMGGGGYARIEIAREARPAAQWLLSLGVTPVILYYRLPSDGWAPVAPFQDAQRAMRLLRARAGNLGIDPDRIGVLGFSSGGNLAGITATRFDHDFYPAVDGADTQSSRPDFAGLIYPVSSMQPPYDTTRTRRELAPENDSATAYTLQEHVSRRTPPTFIAQAEDDPVVNVGASLSLFDALQRHGVPAELHVFETGGHGWGLGRPGTRVGIWPRLFDGWMKQDGWLSPAHHASTASRDEADE